jgi:cyclopropane fatty-acyl-phospholipid synthase-like methyltransferase
VAVKLTQLLSIPGGFDLYQRIVGGPAAKARFVGEFVRPKQGERILDVGCGTGALCAYMPTGTSYVGVDVDERYIESARDRFGGRGEFVASDIADLQTADREPFDAAIAFGVLHHLDDEQVEQAFGVVRPLLAPGGRFVACEPCLTDEAGRLERFLMRHDRGKFIRRPPEYERLAETAFERVSDRVVRGTYRIPFSVLVLDAGS